MKLLNHLYMWFSRLLIPTVLNLRSKNKCRPVVKCDFEHVSGFDITTLQLRLWKRIGLQQFNA